MKERSFLKNKKQFLLFGILFLLLITLPGIISQDSVFGEKIESNNYVISREKVQREINVGEVFRDSIKIANKRDQDIDVGFSSSDSISDFVEFKTESISINSNNESEAYFLIKAEETGNYTGEIRLTGDIEEEISVDLKIRDEEYNPPILIDTSFGKQKEVVLDKSFDFRLAVNKLKPGKVNNTKINYSILSRGEKEEEYFLGSESRNISYSFHEIKTFDFPEDIQIGDHILKVKMDYGKESVTSKTPFKLTRPFFQKRLFGFLPVWILLLAVFVIIAGIVSYILIKKHIESKKKYKMSLDLKTFPKKNPDYFYLGKVAEKNNDVYFEPNKLKTHAIVAGATGGGKSISAQVIAEEALKKNVAVIVFDPTAQWSGMLRKCTDKKMISYYSKFGLKASDAQAFKGNVRQVKNEREMIDIDKYVNPGQIQVFTLNQLKPEKIDIFVASVIRQIFKSNPKEKADLEVLLVFDEVHRLLSKFGGSGEGFLQIERACREFRKWGKGVMLVSQVLSDFVSAIKANISTEVQMRTRDEGDLDRIKTKYGESFLQSLVKASVGVGMFANPAYNHAKPFFLNFRPILHNTRRLSDEELDKYNEYNDVIEDLEYQIEQLEGEGVDIFDLKMELNLVKDKIMSGNFSVVDIYLEGLKPRIKKQWDKLGKKPKKKKVQLVSEEEIKKSVEKAKKDRKKAEKNEKKNEKKEEKKKEVPLEEKKVSPITFNNGIMISSLKEMRNVLPNLDEDVFTDHVNDEKHDIADWIEKNFSKKEGEKISKLKEKDKVVEALKKVGKEKKKEGKSSKDSSEEKSKKKSKKDKSKKTDKKESGKKKKSKKSKKESEEKKEEKEDSE